jgi:peptidoglycan/xylan/chitin deacetylase (PgdA/CDA1 family)/uncharacterized lipoprotein YddW (UPF0748 family)
MEEDLIALQSMGINEPATYFVTGDFAEKYPQFVAALAKNNTIGSHSYSHSNLTEMNEAAQRQELLLSKVLIEKATGNAPLWFRAPYMDYNEKVMRTLKDLGFRFSSSDQERWLRQNILTELPVTTGIQNGYTASDYDLFLKYQMTGNKVLEWLKTNYNDRAKTGRPLVLLLHPRIIAKHAETLHDFIRYVKEESGVFLSFDQYLEKSTISPDKRLGVWVDFSNGTHDPHKIVKDVTQVGFTDVFLMARSPEGITHYRKENDLFGETLHLLKQAGVKVHAWIPVNMNESMAKLHPEWAMVDQRGEASSFWLSPTHPEVRQYLFDTIDDLLKQYNLDGIHLDYLRFPNLNYDFSPHAIKSFTAATGIRMIDPVKQLLSTYYVQWTNWRSDEIERLTIAIRDRISQHSSNTTTFSAALIAQAVTNYRVMESSGQDYGQLAKYLDLIVPMAYFKEEHRTVEWISKVTFASRNNIGSKPMFVGLAAYQKPGSWSYKTNEFARSINIGRSGSEGIVVYPYLYLFGRGAQAWNMPAETPQLLHKLVHQKTEVQQTDLVPMLFLGLGQRYNILALIGGAIVFIAALTVGVKVKWQHHEHGRIPSNDDECCEDWQKLDTQIQQGDLSGRLCQQVSTFLHQIGSHEISKYRIAYVLDLLESTSGSFSLDNLHYPIDGWKVLGYRYLEEASLLGYIYLNNGSTAITAQGRQELVQARSEGYSKDSWEFVEKRLHETLTVECPFCAKRNLTHWFWSDFECSSCRREASLQSCLKIELNRANVETSSFISI